MSAGENSTILPKKFTDNEEKEIYEKTVSLCSGYYMAAFHVRSA